LVIGDLCFSASRRFRHVYDLGAEWTQQVGLPFVYAAWIGRPDVLASGDVALLQESLSLGLANLPEIARVWAEQSGEEAALAEKYLTENIHYSLGARELCGAAAYLERAHAAGLLPQRPVLRLFPGEARSQATCSPGDRSLDSLLADAAAGKRLSFDDGVRLHDSASTATSTTQTRARRLASSAISTGRPATSASTPSRATSWRTSCAKPSTWAASRFCSRAASIRSLASTTTRTFSAG
jgi:hypothetical protein